MIEEIAKQDSIRVKITWTTGGVKTEAEFDATAVEWKKDNYRTDRPLWTLTMVQQPRMVNREEITVVNNTRNPNDGPAMAEQQFRFPDLRDAFPGVFAGVPVGNHEPRTTTIPFDPETHYHDGAGIVRRREIRRTEP